MIKRTHSFQVKQINTPENEPQQNPYPNHPLNPPNQQSIVKSSGPSLHLPTLSKKMYSQGHDKNINHQQNDLKKVKSNIIHSRTVTANEKITNLSQEIILDDDDDEIIIDDFSDLSEEKHHPKQIGMSNPQSPHQKRGKSPPTNNNNNQIIQTAHPKMITSSKSKGTKIPPSVLNNIRMLASGKKPLENMTATKMAKNILENIHSIKNPKNFICEICACEYEENQKSKISKCSHEFCDSCLRHYVDYKIARFQQVSCPAQGCEQIMDKQGAFYGTLSQQLKFKYAKVNAFYEVSKNQNMRMCPNEKCNDGVLIIQNQQNPTCNKCFKVFCNSCLFPVHNGPCEKNQVDFFQNNFHFRQCSKCKAIIEKTIGCNHITCQCKYQFCYLCGAKWTNNQHRCNAPTITDNVPIITNDAPIITNDAPIIANNAPIITNNCFLCICGNRDSCQRTFINLLIKIFICFPLYLIMVVVIFAKYVFLTLFFIIVAILIGLTDYAGKLCFSHPDHCIYYCICCPFTMLLGAGMSLRDLFEQQFHKTIRSYCSQMQNLTQVFFSWTLFCC